MGVWQRQRKESERQRACTVRCRFRREARMSIRAPRGVALAEQVVPYLAIGTAKAVGLNRVAVDADKWASAAQRVGLPSFSRVNSDTNGCLWRGEFDLNTLRR